MSPLARALIWSIERYQRGGGGRRARVECNFNPSCSEYTKLAIQRHGAIPGSRLGLSRIKRCNNRGQVGVTADPVPSDYEGRKMISRASVEAEQEDIRSVVRELPDDIKREYFRRFNDKIRDPDTYAVMSYCLMTGLRHMYLGRWLRGLLDVAAVLIGVLLLLGGVWVGLLPLVVVGVVDLLGLFQSDLIVKHHNNQLARRILRHLRASSSSPTAPVPPSAPPPA